MYIKNRGHMTKMAAMPIYGPQRGKMYFRTIFCLLENQFYVESILFLASNSLYLAGLI